MTVVRSDESRPRRRTAEEAAGQAPIDLGPLDGYIAFHLRRAQDTALRAYTATLDAPFKAGYFATLLVIRRNPGISQSELCRAIGRDKSTMSPLIRDLVSEGLIQRGTSERDRRSVRLHLKAKGDAALDLLIERARIHDDRLDAIVGDLKPELIAVLKKIAAALS